MRKKNQEITDKRILEEILAGSEICRIAMLDHDKPYILPFNYGYKDRFIYIHSAPEGKKIELLRKNNSVCFEIEQTAGIIKHEKPCKWATRYRSVVGYGAIEIITDHEEKKKGLDIIMEQYGRHQDLEYAISQVNNIVILKLNITELTGKQSDNWNEG